LKLKGIKISNLLIAILKNQFGHLILLLALLFGVYKVIETNPFILIGNLWGVETKIWFYIAIASPIFHQVYVLITWRLELHYKSITAAFGLAGFDFFKKGFAILIMSRLVTIAFLAISNANTLKINENLSYLISFLLFIPTVYLFYSVTKYFGMDRAFGIDHFYPEKIMDTPIIKKGIFKYTSNGMYVFGFFILWIPAFLFQSKAALVVALFNHLYIWVHYYFTELPDMKIIYSKK
jgi:hypothetical protein